MKEAYLLRRIAAGIFIDEQIVGSGCLLMSMNKKNTYCVTAAHCIEKKNQIKIKIKSSDDITWEEIEIYDKIEDDQNDIVIFKIKNYEIEEDIGIAKLNDYYKECFILGYPERHINQESTHEICCLRGELNLEFEDKIIINLSDIKDNGEDTKYQIDGISGGGCFVKDNGQYKFFGIETQVHVEDMEFNEVECIYVDLINKLLIKHGWDKLQDPIEYHESNYICNGYRYIDKVDKHLHNKILWVETQSSLYIDKLIESHMLDFDVESRNILLICGFSGIGKTRTVVHACTSNKKLKKVAYFSSYKEFSFAIDKIVDYVQNTDTVFKIVVDDVNFEDWNKCSSTYGGYNNIRIIMISSIFDINSDFNMVKLSSASEKEVKKIIYNVNPVLSEEEQNVIYGLCKDDLRFAILIASIKNSEFKGISNMYSEFHSPDNILEKIWNQYNFKEDLEKSGFKRRIYITSLFIDIGYKNNAHGELEFLADYFGENILELDETIEKCCKSNLGITREDYFELSPRALARLIFEKYGYKLLPKVECFYDKIPNDVMKKRFLERVRECSTPIEENIKKGLNIWFENKYNNINISDFTKKLSRDATRFIEFYPDDGLSWLHSKIIFSEGHELRKFDSYNGRREIVWTCEHLANFEKYFYKCEEILFNLSLYESEQGITNNSQGVWSSFFNVSANTEVCFDKRFDILLKRIKCYKLDWDINLFKKAFKQIFTDSYIRVVPPKIIGGKMTPKSWDVDTLEDLIEIRKKILKILTKEYKKYNFMIQEILLDSFIKSLNLYIGYGLFEFYKEEINSLLETQKIKNMIILQIDSILKMIYYREDFVNKNDLLISLKKWKNELADKSLKGELEAYITRDYWSYYEYEDENYSSIKEEELVLDLVQRIIKDEKKFELMDSILSLDNLKLNSVKRLASYIAENDLDCLFKKYIENQLEINGNIDFVEGYIIGVYKREKNLPKEYCMLLDKYKEKYPNHILTLTINFDITKQGYDRIISLLDKKVVNNSIYYLSKKEWATLLEIKEAKELLSCILKINESSIVVMVIKIVTNWMTIEKFGNQEFIKFIFEFLYKNKELYESYYIFEVIELLKNIPDRYIDNIIELLAYFLDFSALKNDNMYQLNYLISLINGEYDEKIMEEVGKRLVIDFDNNYLRGESIKPFFNKLDESIVMNWINFDPNNRAKMIAYHLEMPSLDKYNVPKLTRKVLDEFEYDEKVFENFIFGIHGWECYNVESILNDKDNYMKILDTYEKDSSKLIVKWAEYEKNRIFNIEKNNKKYLGGYYRHI